ESNATFQGEFFTFEKLFFKMPGEYEIVIGFHLPALLFANNGNICTKGAGSEFIGISFGCIINQAVVDTAPLQNRITLCRCAVNMNTASLLLQRNKQIIQLFTEPVDTILKIGIGFWCVKH